MTETEKHKLIESWYRLSSLARRHKREGDEFNRLANEYYGVEWHVLRTAMDKERIIDTRDCGTDSLTFKEFDELIRSAITE